MSGSNSSDASFARAATRPPESGTAQDHPLGLTVHNLPGVDHAVEQAQRTRSGRLKMIGVLLMCAAPVIASYFTYYVIRPEGRRNFSELIDPQRPMPSLETRDLAGAAGNLTALKGQWLLVSVAPGACDAACQDNLYLQRQMREGVGKEKDRVDWVWLIPDDASPPAEILPGLTKATVLRVDAQALSRWLAPGPGHALRDHLYVVDPMGNWMMRMPAGLDKANASKAKRDLERLLRASSSWDQAGRSGAQ